MNGTSSWLVVGGAFVVGVAALSLLPGTPEEKLALGFGYALLILVFLYGIVILGKMASGDIDLRYLLGESGGGASISRFQLLIFTFVIGLSFFFVVAATRTIPDVPGDVLALLGISATTYGVSKGIQASSGLPSKAPPPTPPPAVAGPPAAGPGGV